MRIENSQNLNTPIRPNLDPKEHAHLHQVSTEIPRNSAEVHRRRAREGILCPRCPLTRPTAYLTRLTSSSPAHAAHGRKQRQELRSFPSLRSRLQSLHPFRRATRRASRPLESSHRAFRASRQLQRPNRPLPFDRVAVRDDSSPSGAANQAVCGGRLPPSTAPSRSASFFSKFWASFVSQTAKQGATDLSLDAVSWVYTTFLRFDVRSSPKRGCTT